MLMHENKEEIAEKLEELLQMTRAGEDIESIRYEYDAYEEYVRVVFKNGYTKIIDVTCDSGHALIKDVIEGIMY